MALSADRITKSKDPSLKSYPQKGSTTIYAGSIVAVDTNGFALPAADAAGLKVVGVAKAQSVNSGSDGAVSVNVEQGLLFDFAASSITQAMVGKVMYVVDDQTFDDAKGTNGVKAGRLQEFISTTRGWILIQPTGPGAVVADADATYGQPEADLINEIKNRLNDAVLG